MAEQQAKRSAGGAGPAIRLNIPAPIATWWRRFAVFFGPPAIIVLLLLAFGVIHTHEAHGSGNKRTEPYEYVYLDLARVESYLGQLDGGDIAQETVTDTSKHSLGGKIEVQALGEVSGSATNEKTSSAVVSLSEADKFYKLEEKLESADALNPVQLSGCCSENVPEGIREAVASAVAASGRTGSAREKLEREELEARSEEALEALPLGSMVKLEGAFIRVPPYLAAYPSLRFAAPRFNARNPVFEAAPLSTFSAAEVELKQSANMERVKFVEQAGTNPRLPLSTKLHELTIVMPARYAYITGDPSLLDSDLTIVGKLVQKGKNFGDGASVATYLPALLHADAAFLHDIGIKERFLEKYYGNRTGLNKALFGALQRSLTFTGKTVEVIPIAIYD